MQNNVTPLSNCLNNTEPGYLSTCLYSNCLVSSPYMCVYVHILYTHTLYIMCIYIYIYTYWAEKGVKNGGLLLELTSGIKFSA